MFDRVRPATLAGGSLLICVGVAIHVQMYLSMAGMHYVMYGTRPGIAMWIGMALIVAGLVDAGWSVLTRRAVARAHEEPCPAMEAAAFGRAQVLTLTVCIVGLAIDVMKPATIGFVLPGMRAEYHISKSTSALLPLIALTGTAAGSFIWGHIADRVGRRPSLLLAGLGFMATAICGAMPTFAWNLAMCWAMGICAGGFLPVMLTMVTETVPRKLRGFATVLVAGLGATAGYLAASGLSSLLIPRYNWRIMWLIGVVTGLALIGLAQLVPESYRFLRLSGRDDEARLVAARLGLRPVEASDDIDAPPASFRALVNSHRRGVMVALGLYALGWGMINYGLFTWLPTMLSGGHGAHTSAHQITALLAQASVLSLPGALVVAVLYARWSSKRTLVASAGLGATGLLGLAIFSAAGTSGSVIVPALVLLIVAVNGMSALMLPYAAEIFPTELRGRGTGFVAGVGKAGGVVGTLFVGLLVTAGKGAAVASLALLVPVGLGIFAVLRNGIETRGLDLVDRLESGRTVASGEPAAVSSGEPAAVA